MLCGRAIIRTASCGINFAMNMGYSYAMKLISKPMLWALNGKMTLIKNCTLPIVPNGRKHTKTGLSASWKETRIILPSLFGVWETNVATVLCFTKCINGSKKRDTTRPVQFEQAGENENTDIVCPMYPKIESMKKYASRTDVTRPYIMCEYAHAMGNSTGNFQEYFDIIAA
ncbi:Beta-galactosidase, partial [termite gut metagenome]